MKKRILLGAAVTLGVLALALCGVGVWNHASTPEIPLSASSFPEKSELSSVEREVRRPHDAIAGQDLDTMISRSTLIVRGKVVSHSEAFQVMSVDGSRSVFTYHDIEPTEILRGTPDDPEKIRVRTEGGIAGDLDVLTDSAPKMEDGADCVFILFQYGMGGGFTTGNDYYQVVGLCQGELALSEDGRYTSVNGESGAYEELKEKIEEYNLSFPVKKDWYREEFYKTQKSNLENDVITQEGYEQILQEVDQYATILPETYSEAQDTEERRPLE